MPTITTILLMTTAIMTITTSTATATMVMMAWLLLLLLLLLRLRLLLMMVLRRYTVSVPMVEQVRADFDVRFHLLVVFAGQITTAADR